MFSSFADDFLYLDVVKTKMQTSPERFSNSVFSAATDIVKTEGVSFLLAGLGPTVVGYGLEGALKFGFYETFKIVLANFTPYRLLNYVLASVIAGAIASIVLVSGCSRFLFFLSFLFISLLFP
jgi:solute carrier family 25 phosphate transporter 3